MTENALERAALYANAIRINTKNSGANYAVC